MSQSATPESWRPPGLSVDSTALPPLPPVLDEQLRRRVFTHKSAIPRPPPGAETIALGYYNRDLQTYERDETVGDGALSFRVAFDLAERYPTLSSGCLVVSLGQAQAENRAADHT